MHWPLVIPCGIQQSQWAVVVEPGGHVGGLPLSLSTCPPGVAAGSPIVSVGVEALFTSALGLQTPWVVKDVKLDSRPCKFSATRMNTHFPA